MRNLSKRVSAQVQYSLYHQLTSSEPAPTSLEPEEVLVADPRGGLTPVQMVDQKLMTLLGSNYPGSFSPGNGSRGNIRRISGK